MAKRHWEQVAVTTSAPRRWLAPLAGVIGIVLLFSVGMGFQTALILAIPFAGLIPLLFWILFPSTQVVDVRTVDDGIAIGKRIIHGADVELVTIEQYAPLLRIDLVGEALLVDVPLEDAQRIHAILTRESGPPTVGVTFTVASTALLGRARAARVYGLCIIVALVVAVAVAVCVKPVLGVLAGVALLASALFVARRIMTRTHVTVGSDGVLLQSGAVSKFVPLSSISTLEALDLHAASRGRPALRRALRGLRGRANDPPSDVVVEPGALSATEPAEWIGAMRRTRVESSYRAAPVDEAVCWRVAEDAAAPAEQRAAAAIAVAATDEARVRVRAIAKAVAAPELRTVLDAVADGDEARLMEAVTTLKRMRTPD